MLPLAALRRVPVTATILLLLLAQAAALTGCRAPAQPSGPTEVVLHISDYEAYFDATESILRRYDFPPDRVEREHGLIVSHPTTSRQWFEWWRVDAPGGYQLLESCLATMRCIVTVRIEPVEGSTTQATASQASETQSMTTAPALADGETPPAMPTSGLFRVRVQVDKSRYSAPERQVTTTSGALYMFSERVPTVEGERGPRTRGVHWIPRGRDGLLEAFLLAQLENAVPEVATAE